MRTRSASARHRLRGALLFLGLAVAVSVAAPAGADTTTSLGDSGGEGAGPFGGLLQSPEANLFTGAMTQSIPLRIPQGRRKATPDLELVYSSSGGNSIFGFGWDLPLGSIERSTKHGVPRCQGAHTDEFVLSLQGGVLELMPYSGNTYRPKTDEAFLEATKNESANTWEVADRSGLKYRFGTTPASRLWSGSDTFRSTSPCAFTSVWALTQVEDPNGNRIDIDYRVGFDFLYPDRISYGGNAASGSTEHPFRVRFVYETTPHPNPATSYRRGVYELLDQIVERLVIEYRSGPGASYSNVRNYELNHDHEVTVAGCTDPYRALLCQVTVSLLPAQTFEYATSSFGMGLHTETPPAPSAANLRSSNAGADLTRSVMDLNADGYLDLIVPGAGGGGESLWGWYRGGEDGIAPGTNSWSIPPDGDIRIDLLRTQTGYDEGFSQTKRETIDLTGDGIPDFVVADQTPWKVFKGYLGGATPGGFGAFTPWQAPALWLRVDERFNNEHNFRNWQRLVDFNADGRPDLLVATSTQWSVYLNTGTGFESSPVAEFSHAGPITDENKFNSIRRTTLDLFDFNGDGLPDLLQQTTGGINLYLNDGRSLTDAYSWTRRMASIRPRFACSTISTTAGRRPLTSST